jgi:hypothetical protein
LEHYLHLEEAGNNLRRSHMEPWILDIIIGVAVVLVVVGIVWAIDGRRTRHLRQRFGPEYDRAVADFGDRRRAESELTRTEKRLQHMHIRPLTDAERDRFRSEWRRAQARFVDDPNGAVMDADRLVDSIMQARGYTAQSLEERIDNIAIIDPDRADDYRLALAVVLDDRGGPVPTEDMRRAFVTYRELFHHVLEGEEYERAA